jgi:hypothetical protein
LAAGGSGWAGCGHARVGQRRQELQDLGAVVLSSLSAFTFSNS